MIHRIDPRCFAAVAPLFHGHAQYLPVQSVIEHTFPGLVFADSDSEPTTVVVWAPSRWAYTEGDPANSMFLESIPQAIEETIIPFSLQIEKNWFELYVPNDPAWTATTERVLRRFDADCHMESVFVWNRDRYRAFRSNYHPAVEYITHLADLPILPERAQRAVFIAPAFANRTSVAARVVFNDRVLAICRSNGFESGNRFMIDVETFDREQRGKGLATAAAVALLDHCLDRDLEPLWETTDDNVPSRNLARKMGFEEDESYPVYSMEF